MREGRGPQVETACTYGPPAKGSQHLSRAPTTAPGLQQATRFKVGDYQGFRYLVLLVSFERSCGLDILPYSSVEMYVFDKINIHSTHALKLLPFHVQTFIFFFFFKTERSKVSSNALGFVKSSKVLLKFLIIIIPSRKSEKILLFRIISLASIVALLYHRKMSHVLLFRNSLLFTNNSPSEGFL